MPPTIAAVSGPMRHIVHYHLDNHNLDNALFYAERLHAHDPRSNESSYLVALCQYRLGDYTAAHNATKLAGMRGTHLGCSFIFAQACLMLEYFKDGISALEKAKALWSQRLSLGKHTASSRVSHPDAPTVLCLLGKLYRGFKDPKKAVICFEEALKANPFMWDAFTSLCEMNQDLRIPSIFRFTESLYHCFESETNGVDAGEGARAYPGDQTVKKPSARNGIYDASDPFETHRPSNLPAPSSTNNLFSSETEENGDFMLRIAAARSRLAPGSASIPESEGIDTPTGQSSKPEPSIPRVVHNTEPPHAPLRRTRGLQTLDSGLYEAPPKMSYRLGAKRGQKPQVHDEGVPDAPAAAIKTTSGAIPALERKRTASGHPAQPRAGQTEEPGAPQRRSARLNTMFKSSSKAYSGAANLGVAGTRELKKARAPISRIIRPGSSGSSVGRVVSGNRKPVEDNTMDVDPVEAPRVKEPLPPPVKSAELEALKVEEALKWILELMKKLANGYYALSRFQPIEAIQAYHSLPQNHRESPWVIAQIGRAYYEKADYAEAEKVFRKLRHAAPSRIEDMEVYSTILWLLKKDVELSHLSHEMVEIGWDSPQAWCAVGNAMSLNRDHEGALKSFKRATQLNPKFAYAYTLQGHEHVANEEYDRALTSYRNALSADPRHYNAYYGIGRVYEKLGSYDKAYQHFQSASNLNPTNAVLVVCVGTVLEKQKQIMPALQYYSRAVDLAPKAAQARYRKSRALLAIGQLELARKELMVLKDLAPDEANVHFLLGKLYKTMNQNHNAIRHFTIALNLDPRASSQIKEAIESLEDDGGMDDSMIG